LKNLEKRKDYEFLWWAVGLFKLVDCGFEGYYLTDCFICGLSRSVRPRLLLTMRLGKNIEVQPTPPVQAVRTPRYGCTLEEYSRDLRELWALVAGSDERKPLERESWSHSISPERLALAHTLSPTKWVLGPMEKISISISSSVVVSLIKGMLEELCVERGPPIATWIPAYILLAVSRERKRVEVLFMNKKRRSSVLEKFLFEDPRVYSEISSILKR